MRTLLLVCSACLLAAQSPAPSKSPEAIQQQAAPKAEDQRGQNSSDSQPPTGARNPNSANYDADAAKKEKSTLERLFAPETASNWFLFLAACIAAWIALKTLNAIKDQARIARASLTAARIAANAAIRRSSSEPVQYAYPRVERYHAGSHGPDSPVGPPHPSPNGDRATRYGAAPVDEGYR